MAPRAKKASTATPPPPAPVSAPAPSAKRSPAGIVFAFLIGLAALILLDQFGRGRLARAPEPTPVVSDQQEVVEEAPPALTVASGTHIVFQRREVIDRGSEDWANDDTVQYTFVRYRLGDEEPVEFFEAVESNEAGGGISVSKHDTTRLLLHRLVEKNGQNPDTLLTLDGTWELQPENLNLLRGQDNSEIMALPYMEDHSVQFLGFSATADKIFGVSYAYGDETSDTGLSVPQAPTVLHMVDLRTGEGKEVLRDDGFVLSHITPSPDETRVAYSIGADPGEEAAVWIQKLGEERTNNHLYLSGTPVEWIDNQFLLVRRGGEFILLDTESRRIYLLERSVGRWWDPDYREVEFIGVFIIP